jgi:hypothetical protein
MGLTASRSGRPRSVPTDPQPPTVSDVARRAAEACDPHETNEGVADFLSRLEDRDEPVTAVSDLESQLAETAGAVDPEGEDPAVVMMSTVILHLSHRRDELSADARRLLEQAARDEFDGKPPEHVRRWLAERGVTP